jgi:hypothetical protein
MTTVMMMMMMMRIRMRMEMMMMTLVMMIMMMIMMMMMCAFQTMMALMAMMHHNSQRTSRPEIHWIPLTLSNLQ